ncbi:hypothetical protein B0H14DRAFT_2658593 [Mycena olivaceomarginata]|nr:hypothetical protein B0H14DRAFT_2658593 [Mycena olivaceomarginata]
MPLSETALGALLIARSAYIEDASYGISDFVAVIKTHTILKGEQTRTETPSRLLEAWKFGSYCVGYQEFVVSYYCCSYSQESASTTAILSPQPRNVWWVGA